MIELDVNGKKYKVDVAPDVPLLWVIREQVGLTGTKFGCGRALCGACTVHINGKAERSCQILVKDAQGKKITTIEGIGVTPAGKALQDAWIADDVPQCGYCQSGQIMEAAALMNEKPKPSDTDIDDWMSGNICRCGTYHRIRRAIQKASKVVTEGGRP